MDNKQAIKHLKSISIHNNLANWEENALDKAIASLEAWDKIKEELEKEMEEYDNVITDLDYATGVGYALEVINKHLGI